MAQNAGRVDGSCKIKNGWVNEDSVRVRYSDGRTLEIPATQYKDMGYLPHFDELDWCEDD